MRKLLQQFKKIVFFDTETTGLDPERDQIIELAAALVTENGIELKIDAFCKLPEGEKIPEKIVELTHITDDMLADKGIEHYGLADKVQNSHRAIDDVLALYEVTKAMSEERDDLTDYIDLLGYNPKYGITGRKLRQITYLPQSYKLGCRLPDLMNGGGSCE